MYRQFIQSGKLMNIFLKESSPFIKINNEVDLIKRWAGHSKWANIKHTKAINDRNKSMLYQKLCFKIMQAVKTGGDNPKVNIKLKMAVEQAQKSLVPNATIEKAIKTAKESQLEKPYWVLFRRKDDLQIAFEVVSKNPQTARSQITSVFKRMNMTYEKCPTDFFVEKGIIISEPVTDTSSSIDKATEDAIEIGIDEVQEDDDKSLIFECMPEMLEVVHQKLEKKGYKIQSASTEISFHSLVEVNEKDTKQISDLTEKLNLVYRDLLRISVNSN